MTQGPIDLLIAFEKASVAPIRPEYIEGTVIVPPQPDYNHSKGIPGAIQLPAKCECI